MKLKVFFTFFILISCDNSSAPGLLEELENPITEPQIYLSESQKFVGLKDFNREESQVLLLSDKIIFPKRNNEEIPSSPSPWKTLDSFKNPQDIKTKISSFCFHPKHDYSEERLVREVGHPSSPTSFSVLELLPREVFLSPHPKNFYCSFFFAFKNEAGLFDHYSISQQIIYPLFAGFENSPPPQELSLIRETAEGYLPLQNKALKKEDLSKIRFFDRSKKSVKNYLLFCEGLKTLKLPGSPSALSLAFIHLSQTSPKNTPEGLSLCRLFSEGESGKTQGISPPFQIDFESLKGKPTPLTNLEAFLAPDLISPGNPGASTAPLNSWFQFQEMNPLTEEISPINIQVNTECFNRRIFGKDQVEVESYNFPFQSRFPLMAVTPKKLFLLDIVSRRVWNIKRKKFKDKRRFAVRLRSLDKYNTTCLYKIQLKSMKDPKISKTFPIRKQEITFSNGSYGIDYNPLGHHSEINPLSLSQRNRDRYFLSLRDIDRAGHLHFAFENPALADQRIIECHSGRESRRESAHSIKVSLDLSTNPPLSLKALFLNPEIRGYIDEKTIAVCRLFIYKNNIIQSFSGEMKITN